MVFPIPAPFDLVVKILVIEARLAVSLAPVAYAWGQEQRINADSPLFGVGSVHPWGRGWVVGYLEVLRHRILDLEGDLQFLVKRELVAGVVAAVVGDFVDRQ